MKTVLNPLHGRAGQPLFVLVPPPPDVPEDDDWPEDEPGEDKAKPRSVFEGDPDLLRLHCSLLAGRWRD